MTEQRHAHQGLPEFHLHGPDNDQSRNRVVKITRNAALLLVILMLIGLGATLLSRWSYSNVLADRAQKNGIMHVLVTSPVPANKNGATAKLVLPGTLLGINEAQIYSRVNGYVSKWLKDIGDPVKKGETLAILDIPEINKQVEEATANHELAKTAYERWKRLRAQDAVSQQELDEKTGIYKQTEAVLKRLRDQQSFGTVVAPFDGNVTRRNINMGDLVNAGNTGTAQAMFTIARTDNLHVYVYMPQDRASQVRVGEEVEIFQISSPDKPYIGRVARTAGAIDTNTRTLQVDVEVPNKDKALLPGSYVEVAMKINTGDTLILPTNTLIFGAGGPYVAAVVDGKIEKKKVKLGIDYGMTVEIKSGVSAQDQIILNPRDSIMDGQPVVVETTKESGKKGS
ncbi:efflux RND transporter periplasmic adaptor subunit [Orrella sp. NBD-18]|uniref:Efflux RND transporter periplasmic adaptor subunit n=1 Tax=Sheuella amnicola TaxID=2707330 RepID=A0A6B2R8X3_9BURK|nr:efflux RND transporter periplasmic adaptor subunit [Sheuella amnicola]NDY83745.1 efflux RND transporter periplasmic adaptor subunit [Sheuella amnicola]